MYIAISGRVKGVAKLRLGYGRGAHVSLLKEVWRRGTSGRSQCGVSITIQKLLTPTSLVCGTRYENKFRGEAETFHILRLWKVNHEEAICLIFTSLLMLRRGSE